MPEYQVRFTDKMGENIIAMGGPGWVYSIDEASFLIQKNLATFFVKVGAQKVPVKAIPNRMFGHHWDLTTENIFCNELDKLPVRRKL